MPQPNLVPGRWRFSRRTQSRGGSGGASREPGFPFELAPFQVLDHALTYFSSPVQPELLHPGGVVALGGFHGSPEPHARFVDRPLEIGHALDREIPPGNCRANLVAERAHRTAVGIG